MIELLSAVMLTGQEVKLRHDAGGFEIRSVSFPAGPPDLTGGINPP